MICVFGPPILLFGANTRDQEDGAAFLDLGAAKKAIPVSKLSRVWQNTRKSFVTFKS